MVDKRRRIAKKPEKTSPQADDWVTEGGVDPEIESPASQAEPVKPSTDEDDKTTEEKTYPHRISFDLTTSQYKRLKWASFDSERPMNDILREAVEDWMQARSY